MRTKPDVRRRESIQDGGSISGDRLPWVTVDGGVWPVIKHAHVSRSLKFIAANYRQPFKLNKLVKVSRMSRRGFLKAFLNHTGMRPGQLLRQVRIEQSKRLLIENDLKLAEIAALSGYERLNSFCVAFRRVAGVAPKKFQRQAWLENYRRHRHQQAGGPARKPATSRKPGRRSSRGKL